MLYVRVHMKEEYRVLEYRSSCSPLRKPKEKKNKKETQKRREKKDI